MHEREATVARMAYDTELADRLRESLAGEEALTEQAMFGGLAFLVHGNMAVAVSSQGGLLVRVPPEQTERMLSRPHVELMEMGGRSMAGWIRVAPEGVKTARQLSSWVTLGAGYARSLPPKAPKAPKAPKRRPATN